MKRIEDALADEATRRSLLTAVILTAVYSVLGIGEWVNHHADRAQGQPARPHIEAACEHLDTNYALFAEPDLASPPQLYQLDIGQIDQNLREAEAAKQRAAENDGLPIFNQDVATAIAEVDAYITFQRRLADAFDLSGRTEGSRLIDAHLDRVLNALNGDDRSQSLDPAPYEFDVHADAVDTLSQDFMFDQIGQYFSHSPEDVVALAQHGLTSLSQLQTVYQQLYAHVFVASVHTTVIEIDRTLSQTAAPETGAAESTQRLARARTAAHLRDADPLPDSLADYRIGSREITVAEVESSYQRFVDAFLSIELSLAALSRGEHARSTALWTDGLTQMYTAHQDTPLYQ